MNTQHSPEPWIIAGMGRKLLVGVERDGQFIRVAEIGDQDYANARRIAACVNTCAGIPTDVLERNPKAPQAVTQAIAELVAAAEEARCFLNDEIANDGQPAGWGEIVRISDRLQAAIKAMKEML